MTNNINTELVLATTMDLLARHYGFGSAADAKAMTPSFEGHSTDIYEWSTSGNDMPTIYWEEGPGDWAYEVPEEVRTYLRGQGLFAEAIRSWCIGLYRLTDPNTIDWTAGHRLSTSRFD